MADKDEPTQTTPKGVEIPVPKREDFLRDLKKVAKLETPAKTERKRKRDK